MKLHLRGLMSKKKILAMDKFLDEWPFTKVRGMECGDENTLVRCAWEPDLD